MAAQLTYWFKDKPYKLLFHTQIKIGDEWVPGVIYMALYENHDGQFWVRTTKDFYEKFKTKPHAIPKTLDSMNAIANLKQEQDNHNE